MKVFSQPITQTGSNHPVLFVPSFEPYLRFLKTKMEKTTHIRAKFYKYILGKFEKHPDLLSSISNEQVLDEHEEIIQLLRMSLLPLAANSDEFMMALAFVRPIRIFYYTEPFKTLMMDNEVVFQSEHDEGLNMKYLITLAIERCYHIKVETGQKIIKQIYNRERHIISHHHVITDGRFIDVAAIDGLPEFDERWTELLSKPDNEVTELINIFPLDRFRFSGFYILYVEDVSREVAINELKNAILNMHNVALEQTLEHVEVAVGELLNDSRIQIGITPFFKINGKVVYDRAFITKCVALSSPDSKFSHGLTINEIYSRFLIHPGPFIYSKITEQLISSKPFLKSLFEHGVKSFMLYPIKTADGLLGVFEVGSVEENGISEKTVDILQLAFPVITDLLYFMIKSLDDRVSQLIKDEFTTLQPSVEWKFNEVAWDYIVRNQLGASEQVIRDVVFEQVQPFYGAVDIRNSSIERNLASKQDYNYQLNRTKDLLQATHAVVALPFVEGLLFKCNQYLASTLETLTQEDELRMNDFFEFDIASFLKYINLRVKGFELDVSEYEQDSDREFGRFHACRRAYETSLQTINKSTVLYFDEEVKRLQQVYPFYFEKYRSDGVEYNIYIGQSIAPDHPFDPLYLRNLRLWQLSAMAEIARMNRQMQSTLPLALQTTQLILVHAQPIDISFRRDEHRFDVEGSYNIRYEIIKKRIDKVRVRDTMERLTQPDKIAIVYTNQRDLEEYSEHISFLANKGLLLEAVELLELEELQGVSGLKAVRVAVRYN